jgi:hypothetical protein
MKRNPSKMDIFIQMSRHDKDRVSLDGKSLFFLGYPYDAYRMLKNMYPEYSVDYLSSSLLIVRGDGFSHRLILDEFLPEMYEIK